MVWSNRRRKPVSARGLPAEQRLGLGLHHIENQLRAGIGSAFQDQLGAGIGAGIGAAFQDQLGAGIGAAFQDQCQTESPRNDDYLAPIGSGIGTAFQDECQTESPRDDEFLAPIGSGIATAFQDQCKTKSPRDDNYRAPTQEVIDWQWRNFTPQAKSFILDTPNRMRCLSSIVHKCSTKNAECCFTACKFWLTDLIHFWSKPQNVECTRMSTAPRLCETAWYLAWAYMQMGSNIACPLIINGAFLQECYSSSIEEVTRMVNSFSTYSDLDGKLPYFMHSILAVKMPEKTRSFIRCYLSNEKARLITNTSIQQVRSNKIKITIEDDANKKETRSFDIVSSVTLKALFNDYADARCISLRSLRFSYAGEILFLSSAGCKTPVQLGMNDGDVIKVHDSGRTSEGSDRRDSHRHSGATTSRSTKKSKAKKPSKKKSRGSNGKKQEQYKGPAEAIEDFKVRHSRQLTEVHDEARSIFDSTRRRLNNLAIERSQPKSSRPRNPKNPTPPPSGTERLLEDGLGGKAGKSRFVVHVGEVQNLYKSTKPSATASSRLAKSAPLMTLDLHGCTSKEALARLDESLEVWVDAAMRGSYPFVREATIVCGCGSQTLSDVVERWIRSNDRVSNAPRARHQREKG